MSGSIAYRAAEGAPASEACRSAADQAAVAQLLRPHVAHGQVFENGHGQGVVRDRDRARVATCRFVE